MSFLLGLTGSIGMGKSTTAGLFAAQSVPVWDADAAVHHLYGAGGAAVKPVAAAFPDALVDGAIDRARLRAALACAPERLGELEAIVHPLTAEDRAQFIAHHKAAPVLLFDIPLLFETGAQDWLDAVVVVTAPADVQKARVLQRPGMDDATLARILQRQMPDSQKRQLADYIIETTSLPQAAAHVQQVLNALPKGKPDA
ncbi:dephospho-CoA kinase [Ketogulonicigenium robustum]|uniref:Dephospho-CoA kinase n=1 Tax=Ketogulonicigenium robustum TaxID=92947 RepID=A0A1W6P2P2_9RHOB|nr:dephospho-CoA kinase [Ketogulonicigenium robustum]ARO15699.1 dephospho-CoA kinase [Ketogulonicigenium robustum]